MKVMRKKGFKAHVIFGGKMAKDERTEIVEKFR